MKNYIQIGTHVGSDEFFGEVFLPLTEKSRIILIEPNPELISCIEERYGKYRDMHEIIIKNCAIALEDGDTFLYMFNSFEHSSLLNRKFFRENIHPVAVKAVTLDTLCKEFEIDDIECLFIDAEGIDYEILNDIDLNKINIQTLYFENWGHDGDDIDNKYRSGPTFLESHIKPKFADYLWEEKTWGLTHNFKLTKKINPSA